MTTNLFDESDRLLEALAAKTAKDIRSAFEKILGYYPKRFQIIRVESSTVARDVDERKTLSSAKNVVNGFRRDYPELSWKVLDLKTDKFVY